MFLAVSAVCISTAIGGAWAMYREVQPLGLGLSSLERVVSMQDAHSLQGLSIASKNQALLDCANTLKGLRSLVMSYRTPEERAQIAPKCRAMADDIVERAPSNAYGWYVGALASAELVDWDGFNKRLEMSWRVGATEQWIGELRVGLAEDNFSRLNDAMIAANDADLHMLVLSNRGVRTIAQRYLSNPEFRERITQIVETMPAQNQTRFVNNVRRYANASGRGR
jgi:hypothetical protein